MKKKRKITDKELLKLLSEKGITIRRSWSQRKYPEISCANPQCQYGSLFQPSDRRTKYCCAQCGTNYRNDKKAKDNKTIYREEPLMRQVDRKLEMIYQEHFKDKHCLVHIDILRLHEVDLNYFIKFEINSSTGIKTLWLYQYGTQRHPQNGDWIYIVKRKHQEE